MVSLHSFMSLCRLCLKADECDSAFHSLESSNSELLNKISVCLPVQISENDDLPKKICLSCSKSVDFVYGFWQLSSNSEKQLQNMLNNLKDPKTNNLLIDGSIGWQPDNSLLLYESLEEKDIVIACKDLNAGANSNVEIKEVYFGDYVNQNDFIEEDIESVVIREAATEFTAEDSVVVPVESNTIIERNTSEDTQISQIVESSNVSLHLNRPAVSDHFFIMSSVKIPESRRLFYSITTSTEGLSAEIWQHGKTFDGDDSLKLNFLDVTLSDFILIPYNYRPEKSIEPNTVVLMDIQNPQPILPVENKSYACNVCQMTFTDQLPFLKHYENVHRLFKCPFCVKYFRRRPILENHLAVHSTHRNFSCPVCKMTFKRQSNMRHHIQRMHSFNKHVKIFECAHCPYKAKEKRSLRIHLQNHMGIPELVCEMCGKFFNTNLELRVHLNNHNDLKPFECDICKSRFTRKHYMLTHRKLVHEDSYSYQCHVCGRGFSFKTSLVAHMKLHTGENRVKCDVCDKVLSSKVSLTNHKKLHLDSKECVCGICGKMYTNRYSLQEHVLSHTSSKPFQCLMCDKTFSTRKKLLHHEQIHDADRSVYSCSQCPKTYLTKYKLKDHFRKNHT